MASLKEIVDCRVWFVGLGGEDDGLVIVTIKTGKNSLRIV
jgi:hypothetical protein